MRYATLKRRLWHRYAVVEWSVIANTYAVVSYHTSRSAALAAALVLVEHFDSTGNVAMLAANEWIVKRAGVAQMLARSFPSVRQPGIQYAR